LQGNIRNKDPVPPLTVGGANAKYLQELEDEKKKKRKAQEEAEDQGENRGIVLAAGEDGQADREKA